MIIIGSDLINEDEGIYEKDEPDNDEPKGPKPKFRQIDLIGEEIKPNRNEAIDIYKSMVAFKNKSGRSISKIEAISIGEGKEEIRFYSKRIFLKLNIITNA